MDRLFVMEDLEAAKVRNAISEAQGEEQRVGQVAWGLGWGEGRQSGCRKRSRCEAGSGSLQLSAD